MAHWVAVDGLLTVCLPAAPFCNNCTCVCVCVVRVFYCHTLTFSHFSTFLFRCNVKWKTHFQFPKNVRVCYFFTCVSCFVLRHVVVATEAQRIKLIVAYNIQLHSCAQKHLQQSDFVPPLSSQITSTFVYFFAVFSIFAIFFFL